MMRKKASQLFILFCLVVGLSGCISSVLTGASLVYDRHNIYKQVGDFQLAANAQRALYEDPTFKCDDCYLDIEAFNGDLLVAGHLPDRRLRQEAKARISKLSGVRRFFIHVAIKRKPSNTIEDSWITTKIRSRILADASINPKQFKVVTADQIVYLMGDVVPEQAKKVIYIARTTSGVKRVVKLFQYYHLTEQE